MTYAEYAETVRQELWNNPSWRPGQTFFNILHRVHPVLADAIRGSDKDPFYKDDRIPGFCEWVEQNWDRG